MTTKKPGASTKTAKPSTAKRAPATKKAEPVKPANMIVNQTEMAEILGITPRRLRQLEKEEEVIVSEGTGKFHVGKIVQAYVAYRSEGAVRKSGSESMDRMREEKTLDIRLNRMRKDRELIALDEAVFVAEELSGLFLSYLIGLPAEITGVPRERQRLNDIIDKGRLRLADRLAEKIAALRTGQETSDAEAED